MSNTDINSNEMIFK